MFCKKCVLKKLAKFKGRHLCRSLFLVFVFAEFLRTPFLENTSGGCFCFWLEICLIQNCLFSLHFIISLEMGLYFFLSFCQITFCFILLKTSFGCCLIELIVTHDDPEVFAGRYFLKKVF